MSLGRPGRPAPGSPSRRASSSGTPARAARRCSCAASARAGWPNGTPSSAEGAASPTAGTPARSARSAFSLSLDLVPVRLDLIGPGDRHVAEHVRMPSHQLGRDPVRDVIDRVPGAVAALGGDPRVEHRLHQHVAQLLADRPLVSGLQGLDGLVGLLEQVRRERGVGLPGVPRALHPQPVHGRDQVDEVRAGQVRRAVQQPGARREPADRRPAWAATPPPRPGRAGVPRPPGRRSPPRPGQAAGDGRAARAPCRRTAAPPRPAS